jgi:2'-5' RNA ligase
MTTIHEGAAARPARIFIGLKVTLTIANELARLAAGLLGSRAKLVAPADIHLTLVAPWQEPTIDQAIERMRSVTGRCAPFSLKLDHLGYGPNRRRPGLLWVDCAATVDLIRLRDALMSAFGQTDSRPFRPHITLARIPEAEWAFARRHPIDLELSLAQGVQTVELFKSPPPDAKGYQVLASTELGSQERI